MTMWYFSVDGKQHGPFKTGQTQDFVRENSGAYCWRAGFSDWQPIFETTEIRRMKKDGVTPFPPPSSEKMSPKPKQLPSVAETHPQSSAKATTNTSNVTDSNTSTGFGTEAISEGIDYKIYGHEMQYVEIELDPGESAVAEAGAMMYKQPSIEMETIFGDGTGQDKGFMSRLLGAGQRLLTGESLFMTVFTHTGLGKSRVAFSAPFPGTIMALKLSNYNGKLICQKDSFLASAKGVAVGIHFQRKIMTGLFGGEGFILQKLEGDGWVFVHMGGTIREIDLAPGESLHVDTGCLAAMTATVDYDITQAGGVKTMLFGGEGLFFAVLTGPGKVWLQSLPFSRLAGRMLASGNTGGSQGEGSLLGGMFSGDR